MIKRQKLFQYVHKDATGKPTILFYTETIILTWLKISFGSCFVVIILSSKNDKLTKWQKGEISNKKKPI